MNFLSLYLGKVGKVALVVGLLDFDCSSIDFTCIPRVNKRPRMSEEVDLTLARKSRVKIRMDEGDAMSLAIS